LEKEVIFKDDKGRPIIKINDHGEMVVGRYVDMTDACKDYVSTLYSELTGTDIDKIKSFLNYESDESEFCS